MEHRALVLTGLASSLARSKRRHAWSKSRGMGLCWPRCRVVVDAALPIDSCCSQSRQDTRRCSASHRPSWHPRAHGRGAHWKSRPHPHPSLPLHPTSAPAPPTPSWAISMRGIVSAARVSQGGGVRADGAGGLEGPLGFCPAPGRAHRRCQQPRVLQPKVPGVCVS